MKRTLPIAFVMAASSALLLLAADEARLETLAAAKKAAGWRLLFDGQSLKRWHNFKKEGVKPSWQVKDGTLACTDLQNAGAIATAVKYGAFALELEFNMSQGANGGIIYQFTDEGADGRATGPEIQFGDNANAAAPQKCGWLYGFYKPADDSKTGRPLDATKPAGEWNHLRAVSDLDKCVREMNGVDCVEYVMGSEDFRKRVTASKFDKTPRFAESDTVYLALQGDHGPVSFRNIRNSRARRGELTGSAPNTRPERL